MKLNNYIILALLLAIVGDSLALFVELESQRKETLAKAKALTKEQALRNELDMLHREIKHLQEKLNRLNSFLFL